MSVEENKALARRFYEEVANKGNLVAVDELVSDKHIHHGAFPGTPPGREGTKQYFTMFGTAFPDLQITIEDMIAEGDKVVSHVTARGTHKGEFMGIAPTNRPITITGIAIMRFAGGKIVETWVIRDDLGMMQQLGVVPKPGRK